MRKLQNDKYGQAYYLIWLMAVQKEVVISKSTPTRPEDQEYQTTRMPLFGGIPGLEMLTYSPTNVGREEGPERRGRSLALFVSTDGRTPEALVFFYARFKLLDRCVRADEALELSL